MRKLLIISLVFVSALTFKNGWCQDNLLAVDVIGDKQKAGEEQDKGPAKDKNSGVQAQQETQQPAEDSEDDLGKIKAYHELFDNKQKELELIRLDLEKSNLLLKKKEAEKEIYQIEEALPQAKKKEASGLVKEPAVDASEMKIQLLLISDGLKEGRITLKGSTCSFKEGDIVASKLTAEKIDSTGVTFKQQDGSVLKLNFVN